MMHSLLTAINARGERAAAVPVSRLTDLAQVLDDLAQSPFVSANISWMAKRTIRTAPEDLGFTPRSLLIVASKSPEVRLAIMHAGRRIQTGLPPTYRDNEAKAQALQAFLEGFLAPNGFSAVEVGRLPKKLLAVRSGLGRYGRNNICYVEGLGSYVDLIVYYTDLPTEEDPWQPARRMASCDDCAACVTACPTGAISADRQVINADRCLTYLNEHDNDSFPAWLDPKSHEMLVGCLRCQACCPENAENAAFFVECEGFDEAETQMILTHAKEAPYPEAIAAKIDGLGITGYGKVLPRNVRALVER